MSSTSQTVYLFIYLFYPQGTKALQRGVGNKSNNYTQGTKSQTTQTIGNMRLVIELQKRAWSVIDVRDAGKRFQSLQVLGIKEA